MFAKIKSYLNKSFTTPALVIAFLMVGTPILYTFREYLVAGKQIFTYSILLLFFLLLLSMNFKTIIKQTLHFSKLWLFTFCASIASLLIFLYSAVITNGINFQSINILLAIYLFIFATYRKPLEYAGFLKAVVYISSISLVITFFMTPMSFSKFQLGLFYAGDTHNHNLVSWVAFLNIIFSAIYLRGKNILESESIFLIAVGLISFYLYLFSFSKSSIIGIIFLIILLHKFVKIKPVYYLYAMFFSVFVIAMLYVFYDGTTDYVNDVLSSLKVLLFGGQAMPTYKIRHEAFSLAFSMMSVDNWFGYGINTISSKIEFDSPFLECAIDLGNIVALLYFYVAVLLPLYIIFKINPVSVSADEKTAIVYYIFMLPNLFLHGSPYEYDAWLPVIVFYALLSDRIRMVRWN